MLEGEWLSSVFAGRRPGVWPVGQCGRLGCEWRAILGRYERQYPLDGLALELFARAPSRVLPCANTRPYARCGRPREIGTPQGYAQTSPASVDQSGRLPTRHWKRPATLSPLEHVNSDSQSRVAWAYRVLAQKAGAAAPSAWFCDAGSLRIA